MTLVVKTPPANAGEMRHMDLIPWLERSLEEDMAIHFSMLAWRIPWAEESGRLKSIGSH